MFLFCFEASPFSRLSNSLGFIRIIRKVNKVDQRLKFGGTDTIGILNTIASAGLNGSIEFMCSRNLSWKVMPWQNLL